MTRTMTPYILIGLLFSSVIVFTTSRYGIGIQADSPDYIRDAEIIRDQGFFVENTLRHFPPLTSILLVLFSINLDIILWAYALLLGLNMVVFTYLLHTLDVRPWILVSVVFVVGLTPDIVYRHSMVVSEPVFYLLLQLALFMTVKDRLAWAIVFAGLAPLQRYAGLTVIATCCLYLFSQRRFRKGLIFLGVASTPIGLWFLRNSLIAQNAGRDIHLHLISQNHIQMGLETLAFWSLPIFCFALLGFVLNRRHFKLDVPPLVKIAALHILIYISFLFLSISLFDYLTPYRAYGELSLFGNLDLLPET